MITQHSAGVIVFRREGRSIKYLLLHHGGQYWNFPKGRQEEGEDYMQTALRELKEETGIEKIQINNGFTYEHCYDFDTDIKDGQKKKINKKVTFFLGEVVDKDVKVSSEHLDFGWFDFNTAKKECFIKMVKICWLKPINSF